MTVSVIPVPGIPEVEPGDDLPRLIVEALEQAGIVLQDGDVLVVTSLVVAKAEGAVVELGDDGPDAH
ncbi:MAG: coenzyme F420-0:L-glutamate ligase, partial [Acidimicrobiia bacterium]